MAVSFWSVARRPRWIAALILALGIAAGFAALGQWQISRSVENAHVAEGPDTETAVPLDRIAEPQQAVTPQQQGRMVTVEGEFVPGDAVALTGRSDGRGAQGAWLVGHLRTPDGVTLVVALGWAPDEEAALAAARPRAGSWTGRYLATEPASDSDFEAGERSAISVPELINVWDDTIPTYAGYLILADEWPGLEVIHAPPPDREASLNALNVFYAIEWVVFAGFAFYLWWRLVMDVLERERAGGGPEAAAVD